MDGNLDHFKLYVHKQCWVIISFQADDSCMFLFTPCSCLRWYTYSWFGCLFKILRHIAKLSLIISSCIQKSREDVCYFFMSISFWKMSLMSLSDGERCWWCHWVGDSNEANQIRSTYGSDINEYGAEILMERDRVSVISFESSHKSRLILLWDFLISSASKIHSFA